MFYEPQTLKSQFYEIPNLKKISYRILRNIHHSFQMFLYVFSFSFSKYTIKNTPKCKKSPRSVSKSKCPIIIIDLTNSKWSAWAYACDFCDSTMSHQDIKFTSLFNKWPNGFANGIVNYPEI